MRRSRRRRRSRPRRRVRSRSARSGSCRRSTRWPRAQPLEPAPAVDGRRSPRTSLDPHDPHVLPLTARSEEPHAVVDRLFREEQGRAVATLIRVLGDFDLAEEAVQDAFITALETWPQRGVPANPGAWITTTARNRAIDRLRRRRVLAEKAEILGRQALIEEELAAIDPDAAIDGADVPS